MYSNSDHNLNNQVFYEIICKPSIRNDKQEYSFESIVFPSKVDIAS